ncbi:MAG TPA: thioredoxin family protein [Terriglobia bacterium]|nr:thioredoxin family protein [Terriglobia bacterium]
MTNRVLGLLALCGLMIGAAQARAATQQIYDTQADAHRDIAAAIAQASKTGRNVVLVFGANWCPDCHALDAQMHRPELARLVARDFVVVKVDLGRYDKNLDVAAKYDVPVNKGIPALAVLDPHGKLLYSQSQGQFANARAMPYRDFAEFFRKWTPKR